VCRRRGGEKWRGEEERMTRGRGEGKRRGGGGCGKAGREGLGGKVSLRTMKGGEGGGGGLAK